MLNICSAVKNVLIRPCHPSIRENSYSHYYAVTKCPVLPPTPQIKPSEINSGNNYNNNNNKRFFFFRFFLTRNARCPDKITHYILLVTHKQCTEQQVYTEKTVFRSNVVRVNLTTNPVAVLSTCNFSGIISDEFFFFFFSHSRRKQLERSRPFPRRVRDKLTRNPSRTSQGRRPSIS